MPTSLPRGTSFQEFQLDSSQPINVAYVPGAQLVRIVLAIEDRSSATPSHGMPPPTAILGMSMGIEAALGIYLEIRKLALSMDWPLPKEDKDQA